MKSPAGPLEQAAAGTLPEWAQAGPARRAHMARVASLMQSWAAASGRDAEDQDRWAAAGMLHDVLRDAPADQLLPWLEPPFRDLPEGFLHGPAAAARLEREGVTDQDVLQAIRFHTLGHPDLCVLGRALIAADALEPGRRGQAEWRARLRERMPAELDAVLAEVVRARIERSLEEGGPIRPELLGLWNRLVSNGQA